MATAGDQINYALRLLGVLAEGESPSASTSSDALTALNQMLDSWSTERLSVYCTQDQSFTWPSGQASRTLGPDGDFIGVRPILLDPSTYFVVNDISYGLRMVNQDEYNAVAVKDVTSPYPSVMWVNPTLSSGGVGQNITVTLWPVPSQDLEMHFISVKELAQADELTTVLYFPPGYLRAFAYNLAVELAPQFGGEASQTVKRIAAASKRNLKRINNPDDLLAMPALLVARNYGFNVYTGGFA